MGCCGSSESSKNAIVPEKRKSDIKIQIDQGSDDKLNETPPFRRKKKPETPEKPKEIEIKNKIPLNGHSQNVDLCKWSPMDDVIVTAGTDRKVFLWNIESSQQEVPDKRELQLPDDRDGATCIHWAEDGRFLILGTEHGYVVLYSSQGKQLFHWRPHEKLTNAAKINGDFVVSVANDLLCIFCISRREWIKLNWNGFVGLTDVEWMSVDQFLVADADGGITLDTVEESSFMPLEHNHEPPADVPEHQFLSHTNGIYQIKRHPTKSKIFASCSVDTTIKIWSLAHHQPLKTLEGHFGFVLNIEWVGGSDDLVSGSFDGSIKIWNTKSGDCLHSLDQHRDRVSKLSVSPDGHYIASGGYDGQVNFWSTNTGELVNTYEGPGRILHVEFNFSAGYLASTSYGEAEILRLKYNSTKS